jgi:hypothetical protein
LSENGKQTPPALLPPSGPADQNGRTSVHSASSPRAPPSPFQKEPQFSDGNPFEDSEATPAKEGYVARPLKSAMASPRVQTPGPIQGGGYFESGDSMAKPVKSVAMLAVEGKHANELKLVLTRKHARTTMDLLEKRRDLVIVKVSLAQE